MKKKKAKTSSKQLSKKAAKAATKTKKADTSERLATAAKRPSALDAAAQILAEAGKPLSCPVIMDCMLAKGLWQTKGKTPAASLYAAVIREIAKKGEASRFRKTDRGKFALVK